MDKYVCAENACTGCRACADICARNAIEIEDTLDRICAKIDETRCVDCGLCKAVCPNSHPVDAIKPIAWYQGWSVSREGRQRSSSGGAATALAETVISEGGAVAGCYFRKGQFLFKLAETQKELEDFRGSKYVKSDPTGIYKAVRQKLIQGRTVMFVGLPCQVAGLRNFVGSRLAEKLITVDLICHGTPSAKLLSSFLKQHGVDMDCVDRMEFRRGIDYRLYIDGMAMLHPRVQDKYTLSFLKAINCTENCHHCQYAKLERVSDITLGDSWGSQLPDAEQKCGISLVLCQTEKGKQWAQKAALHLESVDLEDAVRNNHQLSRPAQMPEKRTAFFKTVKSGGNYDWAVMCAYPRECMKLDMKRIIVKMLDVLKHS